MKKLKLGENVTQALRRFEKPAPHVWNDRTSEIWSFFCPFCRADRKTAFRPRPERLRHIFQVSITSIAITLFGWHVFGWGWKGLVSFVPIWTIFEIVYRSKIRATLSCPYCGFDPYLYLVDVKRARRDIEIHWRKKFAEVGIPYPEKTPIPKNHSNESLTGVTRES